MAGIKEDLVASDRAVLLTLYEDTEGDDWKNNENWCSDKPLGEWYGVKTDDEGRVFGLILENNNLDGTIPECICNLTKLKYFNTSRNNGLHINGRVVLGIFYNATSGSNWKNNENWCSDKPLGEWYGVKTNSSTVIGLSLENNNLTGPIPEVLCYIPLYDLSLSGNKLTGPIPESICHFDFLETLNLSGNTLTGSIPEGILNLTKLKEFDFSNNAITGGFPASSYQWPAALRVSSAGNADFDGRNQPWLHRVTAIANIAEVKSKLQKFVLIVGTTLAYADVVSDCSAAYLVYLNGQYLYFALQLFFFLFPSCYMAVTIPEQNIWERVSTVLQLRFLVEAYRSFVGEKETTMFLSMKYLEAIVEAIPSAMLQLAIVLTSDRFLGSFQSSFLLFSVLLSMSSVAAMLHKMFPVKQRNHFMLVGQRSGYSQGASVSLHLLFHFSEVLFRVCTFVAMFISVGGYGLIHLGISVLFRFIIIMADRNENVPIRVRITKSFIASASESIFDERTFENTELHLLRYVLALSVIDSIIAFVILFTVPNCPVAYHRRVNLLTIALAAFGMKLLYYIDRGWFGCFLNGPIRAIELRAMSFGALLMGSSLCCHSCVSEETPENKMSGDHVHVEVTDMGGLEESVVLAEAEGGEGEEIEEQQV